MFNKSLQLTLHIVPLVLTRTKSFKYSNSVGSIWLLECHEKHQLNIFYHRSQRILTTREMVEASVAQLFDTTLQILHPKERA